MRLLFPGLLLGFYSYLCIAQDAKSSFCSKRSTGEFDDLTLSAKVQRRQNRALEWFDPPKGEGYVSPERQQKGFSELAEYKIYCAEHCNPYETLSMYVDIGQIYFDLQRFDEVISTYQQALNTSVRIPIGYEKDMLVNTANIYFDRGEYQLLEPCLDRLNELGTFSLLFDGHLMAASKLVKGKNEDALAYINTVIKYMEESAGIAKSEDYRIKKQIFEKMGRETDSSLNAKLDEAIEFEMQPSIVYGAAPKIPGAVAKGKVSGMCQLEFDVLPNGKTENVHIVACDDKLLEPPSIKAIEESIFRPRIVDGNPVKTTGIKHTFSYSKSGAG